MPSPDSYAASPFLEIDSIPVINSTFCGNFSLIAPGTSTLQKAIPIPTRKVPIYNSETHVIERIPMPNSNKRSPNNNARSLEKRFPTFGAIGDTHANVNNGRLVINPALQLERPTSSRIKPTSGPTEIIAGRRLKANTTIPIYNKKRYKRFVSSDALS